MNTNFQIQLSVEDDEFSYQNYSQNLNLSEAEEKKEKDPFDISMSELSNMETSPSQIKYGLSLDENEENKKELETCKNKIFRTDIKGENDRLIMNRISARKSRLKKKKYFEVGSCSNLGDAQARRLKIRVKGEDGNKYLAHTLNNTVVAPPRMLIAFLENNLNADGSVNIPVALRPYMGGKEKLVPTK